MGLGSPVRPGVILSLLSLRDPDAFRVRATRQLTIAYARIVSPTIIRFEASCADLITHRPSSNAIT